MFEKEWLTGNKDLSAVELTPLEERVAKEQPALMDGLKKAKELLGEEKYARYISPLQNIAKNSTTLLIRTKNVLERTFVISECQDALREAFGVRTVRIKKKKKMARVKL